MPCTGQATAMAAAERKPLRTHVSSTGNSASPDTQATGNFSRAGRRVLAELACNDSPIVGLLPAGTPNSSCEGKSGNGHTHRSRRFLMADTLPSQSSCTPLGESLLRSQVQLLLQKIGSDISANQLEKLSFLGASSSIVVAPTPLNTPASVMIAHLPPSGSEMASSQDAGIDRHIGNTEFQNQMSLTMSKQQSDSPQEMCNVASLGTHCFLNPATGYASTGLQAPMPIEDIGTRSLAESFVGGRVLNFDDDTTFTVSLEEELSRTLFEGSADCGSAMRQLEDDETSEWSVNVNVGSPVDKETLIELLESTATGPTGAEEDPSMVFEHVKMMQQVSSSKVQLLWNKNTERSAFEDESNNETEDDGKSAFDHNQNNSCSAYADEYSSTDHDECYGDKECNDVYDMFMDMKPGEVGHGLPRKEDKHIRLGRH